MGYTDVSTNTAHLWSFFNRVPLEVVEATRVFAQLGDEKPLKQKYGIQAIWTKVKRLPAVTSATTVGTPVTPRAITSAQVTAQVDQYKDAVGLTDLWMASNANDEIEKHLRGIVSEQMQRSIDLICRNALTTGINTTQYGAGRSALSALGPTDKLTLPTAQLAKVTLEANDVAPHKTGYYVFIGHPNTLYDMKTDTAGGGWVDTHKYSDAGYKSLFNEEAGQADNIKFLKTSLVSSSNSGTSGSAYAYTNMIFGFQPFGTVKLDGFSYGLQWHPPGDSGVSDPNDELATLGWKIYYACKYFGNVSSVSDPDRAIKVITGRAA